MNQSSQILLIGAEDEENLALRSLAAFLESRGITARVVGFSRPGDRAQVLAQVRRYQPKVVAVSLAFQCGANTSFELLRQLRTNGYRGHIVVGGHFPTFEYRKILETQPAIDSVMRYEGEHGIVQLVEAMERGTALQDVPNLVFRTVQGLTENPCLNQFMDLDPLPFPVRRRPVQRRLGERFASVVASRGCWHSSCLYCCIGAFHREKGAKFALRSAGNVAEEIVQLHRTLGINLLQFHDDNFVLPTPELTCERLQALRRELEQRGLAAGKLAVLIKARPDVVDDAVALALAEMGCVGVFLGLENATESGLRALGRGTKPSENERALDCLTRQGIGVTYNLLIFHPHATLDELRANVAFVRRHPMLPFDFGRAEIVAGSPLERQVLREGTRCGTWPMWDYRLHDPAVARAFEINRITFRAPGAAYPHLMHALIALCYHAGTLRRLHAGPSAEALGAAVADLITAVNLFVAERIERMIDLAAGERDEAGIKELHAALQDGCQRWLRKGGDLEQEMLRLQTAEHVFEWFGIRPLLQDWSLSGLFGVRGGMMPAGTRSRHP